MIARVVGEMGTAGGHGKMAGAQIALDEVDPDAGEEVLRRLLAELGKDPDTPPQSLIRK
jgi:nanoRNase/pAp phosphatase (c-di-AMP/oligoRNAs hydrolase)